MTDPDDDWGDLARELGVQKPTTPAPEEASATEPAPEAVEDEPEFADGLADESAAGDEDAEGEAGDGEGDGPGGEEAPGEGQPGTGRKRRRRRRRRKKGGAAEGGETADAGIADEPAPSYQAAARAPVATPAVTVAAAAAAAEPAEDDEGGDEGEFGGPVPAVEEDTAGEVLRELIATWNVPSWDEIISGLHRP